MDTMPAPPAPKKSIIPFIATLTILVFGVASIVKSLDVVAVKGDWADRRCELFVMAAAPLFKPADDPRSAAAFAADNFDFCMRNIQSTATKAVMAPAYMMANEQMGASSTIEQTLNNLRTTMANTVKNTVGVVMSSFYEQFKRYAAAAALTAQRMRAAMNRISASVTAMLYMAISTVRAILNAIDFILLVAIIVVTILAILFIILFFVLFPSVPLILSVIALLVAAGVQVGSLRETFCFAPHTEIVREDGVNTVAAANLRVGDRLFGGGVVTGMYMFEGEWSPMYDLYGIHVAGDHMVYDEQKSEWCYVRDHGAAQEALHRYRRVYCPVVSNRRVPVCGAGHRVVIFRDWEEVETEAEEITWEKWVWSVLNPGVEEPAAIPQTDHIGFSEDAIVYMKDGARRPISTVQIGDYVMDANDRLTRVLGMYWGSGGSSGSSSGGARCGNWILGADSVWRRGAGARAVVAGRPLFHLVTESGTFRVDSQVVCDATEVGSTVIHNSYPIVMESIRRGGGLI